MYCRKCGAKLEENAMFCIKCGTKITYHTKSADTEKPLRRISPEILDAVARLKQGDENAFGVLYSHTCSYVYTRARYLLHDEQKALDLVQEVYLAAYRSIQSLQVDESVYAWLGGIVFRQGTKMIRKDKDETLLLPDNEGMFEEMADEAIAVEEEYVRKEDAEIIRGCIDCLSEEQRSVVLAYYYDNLKVEEIAEIFGTSTGTVKSRLFLARKRLRDYIEEQERKQGYKLHASGATVWILAIRYMLEKNAKIPVKEIEGLYHGLCGQLGIVSKDIEFPTDDDMGTVREEVQTQTDAGDGTFDEKDVEKAGASTAKKIGIAVAGTVAAGVAAAIIILAVMGRLPWSMETAQEETAEQEVQSPESQKQEQQETMAESRSVSETAEPAFERKVYELTEEEKELLEEELGFASRQVTSVDGEWYVDVDMLSDDRVLWLAADVLRSAIFRNRENVLDGVSWTSENMMDTTISIEADSFLSYLREAYGREMTRTEVSNLSMGVYSSLGMLLDEGKSVFQWDARSHESEVTPMVEPVITDVWQVSEDRVTISGKYTGGMETLEEASDTFESEWEINDASTMTGGLRLKTLQLYVDMGENAASASWGLKDDMGLMFYAIADSISDENGIAGKIGGPGDISSGNMQVLLGNLLLRDNILNKPIEGDVRSSGSGEVFADFTEEELEGFFADTIGCEFTDEERGFFEKTENGGYRLRYYLGNYGERRLENAGEMRSLGDGIVELTGTYFDPVPDVNEQHRHLTMRLRPNENSLFDGYVLESIHFE